MLKKQCLENNVQLFSLLSILFIVITLLASVLVECGPTAGRKSWPPMKNIDIWGTTLSTNEVADRSSNKKNSSNIKNSDKLNDNYNIVSVNNNFLNNIPSNKTSRKSKGE
jgi:hypothetical protein